MPKSIMSKLWSIIDSSLLSRHIKNMALDGQVCFYRWLFVNLVKPWRCTVEAVEPVNSIIKDVSDAKLLPMTVSAYPVNFVCFYYIMMIQQCCLCPNGRYLSSFPATHTTHPIYVSLVMLQWLWKVTQNPTVSASYQESFKTLAIILL